MKKLIPLLLALAICLCAGCGEATPAATPTPAPTPEATPTPTPTPTPAPTPEPEIIYEVQTDYSQYSSYEKETVEPIYTRLSEDWISDLAPRSDYGMLYPFVGTEMHNQYGSSGYLYGLFDQHGRIVADPSYTVVEAIDSYYWGDNGWTYTPMLRLGRSDGKVMVYAAASFDGSFVTECRYHAVKALACGVLCVDDPDYENFTAYDLEGNVLFTRDELKFDGIYSIFGGENGIYTVELSSEDGSGSYYYMNSDFELFAGPYNMASSFRDGLAIVLEGAGWGVIGLDGEWLIEPDYNSISRGYDGQFLAKKGGKYIVYDIDGNEIFAVYERFLQKTEYGYCGDSGSRWLKSGMPIVIEGEGWQDTEGHLPVVYRNLPDGTTELLNVLSGKKMLLEGDCLARPLYVDFMNVVIGSAAYLHVIDFSAPDSQMLISWDLKKTIPVDTSMGAVFVATDPVTGMEYTQLDGAFYTLGSGLSLAFDYDDILPRIWNGRFIVTDDVSSTCYDTSGNVLFRYPLVLPGED